MDRGAQKRRKQATLAAGSTMLIVLLIIVGVAGYWQWAAIVCAVLALVAAAYFGVRGLKQRRVRS